MTVILINWTVACIVDQHTHANSMKILGVPIDGTLAEYIVVPVAHLTHKPSHLTTQQAAALPLAGVTAYRAVFKQGQLQSGWNVLVTGIGGGVAPFVAQFARLGGAHVYVTSYVPLLSSPLYLVHLCTDRSDISLSSLIVTTQEQRRQNSMGHDAPGSQGRCQLFL
jgi:hypothetical protein